MGREEAHSGSLQEPWIEEVERGEGSWGLRWRGEMGDGARAEERPRPREELPEVPRAKLRGVDQWSQGE